MLRRVFFLLVCNVLTFSVLAYTWSSACRFEDGYYASKAKKFSTKKPKEFTSHQLIVEVEGCLLKQVVSLDGKNTSLITFSPISIDDSGIVELKIGEEVYIITIGFEINW